MVHGYSGKPSFVESLAYSGVMGHISVLFQRLITETPAQNMLCIKACQSIDTSRSKFQYVRDDSHSTFIVVNDCL